MTLTRFYDQQEDTPDRLDQHPRWTIRKQRKVFLHPGWRYHSSLLLCVDTASLGPAGIPIVVPVTGQSSFVARFVGKESDSVSSLCGTPVHSFTEFLLAQSQPETASNDNGPSPYKVCLPLFQLCEHSPDLKGIISHHFIFASNTPLILTSYQAYNLLGRFLKPHYLVLNECADYLRLTKSGSYWRVRIVVFWFLANII